MTKPNFEAVAEDTDWLDVCLAKIRNARVGVFGDFCLDAYWQMDADESELSIETGQAVRRVRSQRYSLGGAGNVVANLAALGVGTIVPIGAVGDDLFGDAMLGLLGGMGIDTEGMFVGPKGWQTWVYSKPYVDGVEENRIDFGSFNEHGDSMCEALEGLLEEAASRCDVIILNQQVSNGLGVGRMIDRINAVIARRLDCQFIVDSRDHAGAYRGAMLKMNDLEAARFCGEEEGGDVLVLADGLRVRAGGDVFVTCGEAGIAVSTDDGTQMTEGVEIIGPVDTVGAGDTVMAALASCLGGGCDTFEAARFANLAASVTVRQLETTGVARPSDVLAAGREANYIYASALAEDVSLARYLDGTRIEIVGDQSSKVVGGAIRHAVFDHDGTLSVLREGWEGVMAPMMCHAILGDRNDEYDAEMQRRVACEVDRLIEQTTGLQTLGQMQYLVELVGRFGLVADDEILDAAGYKAVYYSKLMERVSQRRRRLDSGEQSASDYEIAGARGMLEALRERGVKLYLASGTDQADVVDEVKAMGYADLFEGIYGAAGVVGNVHREAKRELIDRLIKENQLGECGAGGGDGGDGGGGGFVVFGDGPVEMREARKRGGIAVGVASDEVTGGRLNLHKRRRLIRAGADVVIPDFAEIGPLLEWLKIV